MLVYKYRSPRILYEGGAMSEDGPMANSSESEVGRRRTHRADEEDEILGTSPDRTGAVLGWVKSALSPLLSASAIDELHGLDPFFDAGDYDDGRPVIPVVPVINCSYDGCKRSIGPGSSQFGCPGCGLAYCSTHSGHPSFEVQLAEDGKTRYIRVCLVCWMGRPENQTGLGADRSWVNAFSHHRASLKGQRAEQRSRVEARLAQLISIEEESHLSTDVGKRALQQKVAQWVPDEASQSCPICT